MEKLTLALKSNDHRVANKSPSHPIVCNLCHSRGGDRRHIFQSFDHFLTHATRSHSDFRICKQRHCIFLVKLKRIVDHHYQEKHRIRTPPALPRPPPPVPECPPLAPAPAPPCLPLPPPPPAAQGAVNRQDDSLERLVMSSFTLRLVKSYKKKGYLVPPSISFPQLIHGTSEKIAEHPLSGSTIEAIMNFLQNDGLVSELDYSEGNIGDHVSRYKIRCCRKLNSGHASFVKDLTDELANGPVVAVFPLCTDFDLENSAAPYLAAGNTAINEANPPAIVGLVVLLTRCYVIDGIPQWHYRTIGGSGNIELDALFMVYAPVIDF